MNELNSILHSGYQHPVSRSWQNQGRNLTKSMFMYPIFVSDEEEECSPLTSMPDQCRWGVKKLESFIAPLIQKGLTSVILFGVPLKSPKDETGTLADAETGPVISAIKTLRATFPNLFIATDVCLCEYTSHGHCGVLNSDGSINNLASVKRLAEVALKYALAGANCVAPSDMMDGRIGEIKRSLMNAGMVNKITVMSYSAKFASCLYGPFRDAVDSTPSFGDRRCYQLPSTARGLARRAILRDTNEGADLLMVKPALPYLDIMGDMRVLAPDHPIVCYQVSGEFAMIHAGAKAGVYDLRRMAEESVQSMVRAGANIIISYFTPQFLDWLDDPAML